MERAFNSGNRNGTVDIRREPTDNLFLRKRRSSDKPLNIKKCAVCGKEFITSSQNRLVYYVCPFCAKWMKRTNKNV